MATLLLDVSTDPLSATPLTDALTELSHSKIASFHALPLYGGASIADSPFAERYETLFGDTFLRADVSFSGNVLDNALLPTRVVKQSEDLTARAFGADACAYVSCGSTTSNQIAIRSALTPGQPVLVDRSSHQSIYFTLLHGDAKIHDAPVAARCSSTGRSYVDSDALVAEYAAAAARGEPYRLVVLNGASYDGVLQALEHTIEACVAIDDTATFLIDEAWSSINYFHPLYRERLALGAARRVARKFPHRNVRVFVTQSAHKSMSSLRQGSYLHLIGDEDWIARLRLGRYMVHTTSPSYPILASLELARAQAVIEGEHRISHALHLANVLRDELATDPRLAAYALNGDEFIRPNDRPYVAIDPLRISINVSGLSVTGEAFKNYAFREHSVYISRATQDSVLISFHIGISYAHLNRLLKALAAFARLHRAARHTARFMVDVDIRQDVATAAALALASHNVSAGYLIPYPPGVPLLVPGDPFDTPALGRIEAAVRAGVDLVHVPPVRRRQEIAS